ncbi:MAG: hypothetical protein NTX82_01605 [Candidatus Parcubacteria bacterium]|nr:hypothetical protein [Candidatus Parcubacteria bacterium]
MKNVFKTFLLMVAVLVLALSYNCASPSGPGGGGGGPKPIPGTNDVEISVGIDFTNEETGSNPYWDVQPLLVTPGVPPTQLMLFGSIESRACYDPYNCAIDRTSEVVGGAWHHTYRVPINTPLHIGYSLGNYLRGDGITINGVALTTYQALGTAPAQWGVACFIISRNTDGTNTVTGNPSCTAVARRAQIVVTGDSGGSGLSSYSNSIYNMPYDDPFLMNTGAYVAYSGVAGEGPITIQTGLWQNPTPGGITQSMVYNAVVHAYTEEIPFLLSTQANFWAIHHPPRDPTCVGAVPACAAEPQYGIYMNIMPLGGGAVQCTTQLWHYVDFDATAASYIGETFTGFSTTTNCITQDPDTRDAPAGT